MNGITTHLRRLAPLFGLLLFAAALWGLHHALRAYKQKFDPLWEPRYQALPGGLALPRVLTNITTLVSGSLKGALGK